MAGYGRCDYKQLKKLRDKLAKLERVDLEKFSEDAVKELTARLLRKVVKRTPVGKKPKFEGTKTTKVKGAKRSRSFLTAEGARYEQYWAGYQGGTLRNGWTGGQKVDVDAYVNSITVVKVGNEYRIEIINPVDYASYVEFGHRQTPGRYVPALGKQLKNGWVNGKFMLTISEKELNGNKEKIIEAKLLKLLGEAFNG